MLRGPIVERPAMCRWERPGFMVWKGPEEVIRSEKDEPLELLLPLPVISTPWWITAACV